LNRLGLWFVLILFSPAVFSLTYTLPETGSRMIGSLQYHQVQKGETIAKIADDYGVGFLALMAANKGVDPFLPTPGQALTIPSQLLLPDVPYQGIVVNLAELRLYYFWPDKEHVSVFPVGIGRIGRDTPTMETHVSQKRPNPTWTPPQSIRAEYAKKGVTLPDVVPSGPDNPLGLFALRLAFGVGDYLIHGTNKHFGIGLRVSSGCIRMMPKDIDWLFHQVKVGEKVRIINEPIKVSLEPDRTVYMETHEPLTRSDGKKGELVVPKELTWWLDEFKLSDALVSAGLVTQNGIPLVVAKTN
jgi:L,D-transpeptidase YcfS